MRFGGSGVRVWLRPERRKVGGGSAAPGQCRLSPAEQQEGEPRRKRFLTALCSLLIKCCSPCILKKKEVFPLLAAGRDGPCESPELTTHRHTPSGFHGDRASDAQLRGQSSETQGAGCFRAAKIPKPSELISQIYTFLLATACVV